MSELKKIIKDAIEKIAQRKPGRSRLVYDKATRTIRCVDSQTLASKPTGLVIHDTDADVFGCVSIPSSSGELPWMRRKIDTG